MSTIAIAFVMTAGLVTAPAFAQDGGDDRRGDSEDEDESSGGGMLDDLDDIMGDIDLGGGGRKGATTNVMNYSGSVNKSAPDYVAGKKLAVTHYAGPIEVRCTDRKGVSAVLSYSIDGTAEGPMESYGKRIGLSAWGGASGGGVKSSVPSKPSAVTNSEIKLVVNAPQEVDLTILGGTGYVNVTNCGGAVKSSNKTQGAYFTGTFTRFDVGSAQGDVEVDVQDGTTPAGSSKVSAPGGSAKVNLPASFGGKIYAKGADVNVSQTVSGSVTPSLVQGTISSGDASLTVTARDTVSVH